MINIKLKDKNFKFKQYKQNFYKVFLINSFFKKKLYLSMIFCKINLHNCIIKKKNFFFFYKHIKFKNNRIVKYLKKKNLLYKSIKPKFIHLKKKQNFELYTYLIRVLMQNGKKTLISKNLIKIFYLLSKQFKVTKIKLLLFIFLFLNTKVEARPYKIRKRIFLVPFSLSRNRQRYYSVKLLKESLINKNKKNFNYNLSKEIANLIINKKLSIYKKLLENNKLAYKNRMFKHYRW